MSFHSACGYLRAFAVSLAFCAFFVLRCLAQPATSYTISTYAGSGVDGASGITFTGDGGPATGAALGSPASIALARNGDLYISDFTARIRKVDARTGIITTVAGTGARGYSGDGGPATNADLGGPGDIALDADGNLYFADGSNHRIRRIGAKTGIITTIAGNGSPRSGVYSTIEGRTVIKDNGDDGPAINAPIGGPGGLAVDENGNLFFSNGGDLVRKIALRTGIISRVAGAGVSNHSGDGGPAILAQLNQPSKVAVDRNGDVYIAARGEHSIRKVNAATGTISTIAGAREGVNMDLFAPPPLGIRLQHGGFRGEGGPATEAFLNGAQSIALDQAGNLYIADTFNYRIRRIDASSGRIDTIAGTGVKGFSGDGGAATAAQISYSGSIAVDSTGRVYFSDQPNHRIRVLVPTSSAPIR